MGHGAARTKWDQEIVTQAILDDLGYLDPARLDAVLITGDLAFSAKPDQYAKTKDWLNTLIDDFRVTRENVLLVPGNHDLERSICAGGRNASYLEALRRGELLIDNVYDSPDFSEISEKRFAEYKKFAAGYAQECVVTGEWSAVRYLRPDGLFSQSTRSANEEEFIFQGVNTALLAQGDDVRRLAIGLRPLRTLSLPTRRTRSLTFLLSHHPLENVANQQWLQDHEVDQGSQMARSCDITLCGHVHKADAQRVTSLDGTSLRLVAGAVHDDLPEFSDGLLIPRSHGYTLSILTKGSQGWTLEIIPRIWSRTRREFQPHHDISGQASSIRFELRGTYRGTAAKNPSRTDEARVTTVLTLPPTDPVDGHQQDLNFRQWLKYIPERVFAPAAVGFNTSIQEHLYSNLRKTHYYHYKGDSARVTSAEFSQLLQTMPNLNDIKFMLLYPEQATIRRRLFTEKRRAITSAEIETFRNDIFATLVGLHELAEGDVLDGRTVEVSFYREECYYRIEAMAPGVYLTYFLQGGAHGTTFFYPPSGLGENGMFETLTQAFRSAFSHAQEQNEIILRNRSISGRITGPIGHLVSGQSLDEIIRLLGGDYETDYYASIWDQRKTELQGEVGGMER